MKGRRPKPTRLKVIQGNPGKRPLDPSEPEPEVPKDVPQAPAHLSDDAAEEWEYLAPILHKLRLLTVADLLALERLVECYAEVRKLQQVIDTAGHTFEAVGMAGDVIIRQRPEVRMLSDADKRLKAYLIEFGLTPAARSKVSAGEDGGGEDPAEKYLD